jgi:hypothetical protein
METDPGDIDGFEFFTAGAFAGMHVDFLQVDDTETDLVDVYGGDCVDHTPINYLADASCMGAWLLDGTGSTEAGDNKCVGETDDAVWSDVDTSGYNNSGGPGNDDNATDFDGGDDHFSLSHDAKYIASDVTWGCWLDADEVVAGTDPFGKLSIAWAIVFSNNNRVGLYFHDVSELSAPSGFMAAGGWYHIVGRHIDDANDYIELFIDAEPACSDPCNTYDGAAGGSHSIGIGAQYTGNDAFDGQLYECWMMDRGLSDYEICEICRFGLDGTASDRTAQCGACDYTP